MNDYDIFENLNSGAFLTVKNGDEVNTMTIGWGFEGVIWQKKVFVILVRESRYTYELLTKAKYFTVSFPKKGTFKEALNYFGTKSGRDENKYDSNLITLTEASNVDGYFVDGCVQNYECEIIYQQKLQNDSFLNKMIPQKVYADGDIHILFIGEIK